MSRQNRARTVSLIEVAAFVAGVLAFIWLIEPRGRTGLDAISLALIVGFAVFTNVRHRDSRARLGLRVDNVPRSALEAAIATALGAAILFAAGNALHSVTLPPRPASRVLVYLPWALVQQYALQDVVFRRLVDAGLTRPAPLVAAILFVLPHLPNPGLSMLVFVSGWMWCTLFRRHPNLFTLAASHACLAVLAEAALGPYLGGLHIGPDYLHLVGR